jgi:hypothetical protein
MLYVPHPSSMSSIAGRSNLLLDTPVVSGVVLRGMPTAHPWVVFEPSELCVVTWYNFYLLWVWPVRQVLSRCHAQ